MDFRPLRPPGLALLALLLVAGALTPRSTGAMPLITEAPDDARVCGVLARAAETALGIPAKLVLAVGVVESGLYNKKAGRAEPWPWTINAEGKGFRFKSKAEAIKAVEKLQASGVRSIDVGCMQVNLSYHGDAFADLEEAFDPVINTAYGAHFLETLRDERGSWSKAVAAYHSSNPERGVPYRRKVAKAWISLRGEIEEAVETNSRRARIAAAYREQRAAFDARQAELVRVQEAQRSMRTWPEIAPPDSGVIAIRGTRDGESSDEDGPAGDDTVADAVEDPESYPTEAADDTTAEIESNCDTTESGVDPELVDTMLELSGMEQQSATAEVEGEDEVATTGIIPVCPRVIETKPKPARKRAPAVTIIRG